MPSLLAANSAYFNCSICTFKCGKETDFQIHVENTHLKDLFKFPCQNCGLQTKGPKYLTEHKKQCQVIKKNIKGSKSIKVENEVANNEPKAGPSKGVSSTTDEIESNIDGHTEDCYSNIKISQMDGQGTDSDSSLADKSETNEIAKSQKGRKSGGRRKTSQNKPLQTSSNETFTPSNDDDSNDKKEKVQAKKLSRPRRNRSLINLKESSEESNDALEFILKETENQPVVKKPAASKGKSATAKIQKSAKPPPKDDEPSREDTGDKQSIKQSDLVDSDLSAEEEPLKPKSIKSKRTRKPAKKIQQYDDIPGIDSPLEDTETEDIPFKPKKTPKAQKSKSVEDAEAGGGMADQKDSASRPKRARKTPKKLQESPAIQLMEEDSEVSQELLAILAESDEEEMIQSKKSKRRRTKSKKADSESSDEWKPELVVGEEGTLDPSPVVLSSAEVSDDDSDGVIPDLDDDDEDFEPKAVVVKGSKKAAAKNTRKPRRKKSVESKPAVPVPSKPNNQVPSNQSQHNFLVPNNEDGFEDFEPPLLVCKPPMKLKITPEKLKNQSSQSENDSDDNEDNRISDDDGEETFKRKIREKIKSKRAGRAGAVKNFKNLD